MSRWSENSVHRKRAFRLFLAEGTGVKLETWKLFSMTMHVNQVRANAVGTILFSVNEAEVTSQRNRSFSSVVVSLTAEDTNKYVGLSSLVESS